jgi:hypothetical protein
MSESETNPVVVDVDTALPQLLSKDGLVLLNAIDDLRSLGVDKYVDLPTILVCGEQSAGKSSVLEAICKLPFPKGDNVCTTFATELAIRRAPKNSVSVKIQPSRSRTTEERDKISEYQAHSEDLNKFESVVQDAKAFLIQQSNAREASYFEDILHVGTSKA